MIKFTTEKEAQHAILKAKEAMSFRSDDTFVLERSLDKRFFYIAMYSRNLNFCGYY